MTKFHSMTVLIGLAVALAPAVLVTFILLTGQSWADGEDTGDDFIPVINPIVIGADRLPAQRIPVGVPGDYKPSIAKLPNGELLLVMFYPHHLEDGRYQEDITLYRSPDGGLTWSEREVLPLLGREPYLTVLKDGTVFITVHFLIQEWRNKDGYVHSYLYRSTDGGRTWATTRVGPEDLPEAPPNATVTTSRNVLELADGTLLCGVSAPNGIDYLWRSSDRGVSWDKSLTCEFEGASEEYPYGLWNEAFLWRGMSNKLFAIKRVDPRYFPPIPGLELPPAELGDHGERMLVFGAQDDGRTWHNPTNLGTYGEMYPAVLHLQDGRLLFTFTVRALNPPLGVQAVLGYEDEQGLHFDFEHDRLVLDAKTPEGMPSGGGFGSTVQLDDGTLVTSYSYRFGETETQTRVEVVRWKLPARAEAED